MSVSSPAEISWLRARLTGSLALPGEPGYDLAAPFNVAVQMAPAAVVAAANADDIAETVRFANDNGLRVLPQRTGHGAVKMDLEDVLLVHTAQLDELKIDPVGKRARIGAGVIWQQVLDAAAPHGLAPLVGSAPGVGVVGFLTGGGVGPLVRTYGLASDTVLAFEVVTGDGRLLRVTPDEHADLFWGLRGGKNTLGIVTAVEIALLNLTTVHGGAIYFNGTDASGVLHMLAGVGAGAARAREHVDRAAAAPAAPGRAGAPGRPVHGGRAVHEHRRGGRVQRAARPDARRRDPADRHDRRAAARRDRRRPRGPGRPDARARDQRAARRAHPRGDRHAAARRRARGQTRRR